MSRVPAVQYEYSVSRLVAAVRVTVPPPHQLCSLLSPEPAPPITHHHQPAQAAAVTTAVATSSGLHRWQHSAVWKLPRNVLDKNIALHCISTVTVDCGLQCARYPDWISGGYLQFPVLAPRPARGQPGNPGTRTQTQAPIVFSSHDTARPRPGGWSWCWYWEE